jgi:predicted GNAT family acetyltransferase
MNEISFQKATPEYKEHVFQWLEEPYVKEFWDNSQGHRDDILIFMRGRKEPSSYFGGIFDYWIGLINNEPYCLVMTSEILSSQTDLSKLWRDNLSKYGKTCSLDFMIGNPKFLGKGIAAPTLKAFTKFLSEKIDPTVDAFFIDPEESNARAKHVYAKAGFQCLSDFHRDCNGKKDVRHLLMVKRRFSIENVSSENQKEMIDFLKRHEDTCMFMLGNFEVHGATMTEAPNSGNFKLIKQFEDLIAVFCLTRRGTLLVQSETIEPVFELILNECQKEETFLKGVAGEWGFCSRFWEFVKNRHVIGRETFVSKEVLYSLNLEEHSYQTAENVRLLKLQDFSQWKKLNDEYIKEQKLPSELSEEQVRKQFLWQSQQKIIWGLFRDGVLVTVAELNAKALDLGQLGGVYTSPQFRKKGFAKILIRQLIMDVKHLHKIRKLIIFTDEDNFPARRVYESLGGKQVGFFALLFGDFLAHKLP